MNDKPKKRPSFFGNVIRTMFGRGTVEGLSLLEEEMVQSPGKTIMREFFRRKLTIIGLIGFFSLFLASMIIPIFIPPNLVDYDLGNRSSPPFWGMMRVPRAVRGNIRYMDAGPGFGVVVTNDNEIVTWGVRNRYTHDLRYPPVTDRVIAGVSAGHSHMLAYTECGHVYVWGDPNVAFNLAAIPPAIQGYVVTARAGFRTSIAITADGRLHTWGNTPALTHFSLPRFPAHAHAANVEVNWLTAGVLCTEGHLYVLIPSPREFRYVPDEIQGRIVDFTFTGDNGAAILDDGTVVVWGLAGPAMAVPAYAQGRAVQIDGGNDHFTLLLDDGTISSWGGNRHNQASFPNISNVESIVVGAYHNYAFRSDGSISTWGHNGNLLGTDQMGRDIFSRIWYAGRVSMLVGAISVVIAAIIGISLGSIGGYYAGKADMFIMRLGEAVGAIPFLPIAIILQWRFGQIFGQTGRLILIMVVLGVLTWPGTMRLVRATILQARESEYVIAARALGVRQTKIIFRHIMPNIISIVIVQLTLMLAGAMLTETTLSFLGFGVQEPLPTWGNMLTGSNSSIVLREQWWRWVFPALALVTTAVSINLIGDGLREATDPKAQGR